MAFSRKKMSKVAVLGQNDQRRVYSGQVILDPAAVVKELLENSLDSCAKRIDIRVRGTAALRSISVVDNGSGISRDDLGLLCTAHATSKLSDLDDITRVRTMGFRGEALAAIAALSERLVVVTKTDKDETGTAVEYSETGEVEKQSPTPRTVGTTATVENLFCRLPVRKKEAESNSKREVNRIVAIIHTYGLICFGVKISLAMESTTLLQTPGRPLKDNSSDDRGLYENVVALFGSKQGSALVTAVVPSLLSGCEKQPQPSTEDPEDGADPIQNTSDPNVDLRVVDSDEVWSMYGLVSRADRDSGRSSTDRQYVYINRRPVDFPKLTRACNEMYRRFVPSASPVLILSLHAPEAEVDVNIQPDKRKVRFLRENEVVTAVRDALENIWNKNLSSYAPSAATQTFLATSAPNGKDKPSTREQLSSMTAESQSERTPFEPKPEETRNTDVSIAPVVNANSPTERREVGESFGRELLDEAVSKAESEARKALPESLPQRRENHHEDSIFEEKVAADNLGHSEGQVSARINGNGEFQRLPEKRARTAALAGAAAAGSARKGRSLVDFMSRKRRQPASIVPSSSDQDGPSGGMRTNLADVQSSKDRSVESYGKESGASPSARDDDGIRADDDDSEVVITDSAKKRKATDEKPLFEFGGIQVQEGLARDLSSTRERPNGKRGKFNLSSISSSLFNLGFIVCELGGSMFIIDQHAADEKYNYEDLTKRTEIRCQPLVLPQQLELSTEDELIVADNLDVFRSAGFNIEYEREGAPTKRAKLLTVPYSQNTVFGLTDVQQMIAEMKSTSARGGKVSKDLKPKRVAEMLASRACRKSIMIGTALDHGQMRKVVSTLSTLESPWNCPHGRPTMRHLWDLEPAKTILREN
ncbi:hypothetical protein NDN08_004393 [Rhodosorus marinus]|uniref:DNA mismatch repair protein MutL n=1 Tax=Rhodosorus marinus TaxID=101924 RepID=A0AAV8ULK6_9RHOD|nr:hypothetical protein NDN08_004393 [Rhodosorus marinus]